MVVGRRLRGTLLWTSWSFGARSWKSKVQTMCPWRWTSPNLLHNPTTCVGPIPSIAMWFAKIQFGVWQIWWPSSWRLQKQRKLNVHGQVFAAYNKFYSLAHQVQAISFYLASMSSLHLITLHISFSVDCSHHSLHNSYWSLRVLAS